MSMISRNTAGQTKKTVVVAMNFIAWATGNAIGMLAPVIRSSLDCANKTALAGPQVFLSYDSPRYFIAFATHMGCYVVLVLVIIFLRWHLVRQNAKKDALAAAGVQEAKDDKMIHAFDDLTDRENPNFRYIF